MRESEGGAGGEGSAAAEQRRLVREIDGKTRGRLNHSGRRYRLVADVDFRKVQDRDSYEVVRHDDAAKTLDALARESGTSADLAGLFAEAKQKLTPDWRPPLAPDGLILLRRINSPQALSAAVAESITPSQMKKMMTKTEWIEIPNGSVVEGNFDEQGLWGDYDIDPGQCKLILPDVPEAVKPGVTPPVDATTWIALKLVDDEGKPIVGRAYSLKVADGSEHKGSTGEGEIRVDGIAAGTCTLSLQVEGGDGTAAPD